MRRYVGVGLLGQLCCWVLIGYGQVTTGSITGTVTDGTGAVLPGATVTVQNEETGVTRTVKSDNAGRYSAPSLSLGKFRVTGSQEGFQTEVRTGIELTVGRDAVVNLQLAVGAVSQSVEVTGEASLVETSAASVSYLVDDRTIRDLPLNGRDLTQLILLNPGVNLAQNSSTGNAYVGFGKKISIGGMRGEDNAYLLDGSYINDMNRHLPAGPAGALLGAETIREFQVLTNSYGAQYGRAQGGVFNAVSKSGTNDWHGGVYEYLRNDKLDASKWEDNAFGTSKPPFKRNQFGANGGGPIKKDKAFFFAAYEGWRESVGVTQANRVLDDNARRGILPGVANPISISPVTAPYLKLLPPPSPQGRNFGDGTGQFIFQESQPTTEDFEQGRADYQISEKDSLFGRLTFDRSERTEVTNYPEFRTVRSMKTSLVMLSDTHIFSPRALGTARFSFNRVDPRDQGTYPTIDANLLSVPGQPPPGIIVTGLTNWEGAPKPLDTWVTNRFNVQDDINLTLGSHSLQFGGMIERMRFNMNQPDRPFGEWTFRNYADFLLDNPGTYRGTPPQTGNSIRGFRQSFFALYLQDDWRVTPRLTLNLGLRWEPYSIPTEANNLLTNLRHITDRKETAGDPYWKNQSRKDFGPRFGFAWDPFGKGTTSVRGGAGLFFVPNDPTNYRTQATRNDLFPNYGITDAALLKRTFPNALAAIAGSVSSTDEEAIPFENFRSSRAFQYNLMVQQQLPGQTVLALGFVASHGIDQTCYCEYNSPTPTFDGVALAVPANGVRTNPNYSRIWYYANSASSWYDGMTVSAERRFSKNLQTKLGYTFSKSLSHTDSSSKTDSSGSTSGTNGPINARDLTASKGLSGYDLTHVLNVSYIYEVPFGSNLHGVAGGLLSGWQLSGIVSVQSGQPFNVSAASPTALSNLGYAIRTPILNSSFTRDKIIQGGPEQYFNPAAFLLPGAFQLGNLSKNFLHGPGLAKWDFSLAKSTSLTERWRLQFRAELFNLLNHVNYSNPAASVFASNGTRQGNAGFISSTVTTSRQIQFGLKLLF